MDAFKRSCNVLIAAGALATLVGCAGRPITIIHDLPAEYPIPEDVRTIAIAAFGGATAQDRQFGGIVADLLVWQLEATNDQHSRYQLVDRKRLQELLDQRGLQLRISDTATAAEAGRIAEVDAVIYGSVSVLARDRQVSRAGPDRASDRPERIHYTRRYCTVSVNFTVDQVSTPMTLAAVTLSSQYDSPKDDQGQQIGRALGFWGDDLPSANQIHGWLIDACVKQFIRKISPRSVSETVELERGRSRTARKGNKLARAGDYDKALDCYVRAMEADGHDDGAAFNAGVMCEARGDSRQAEQYYSRAFALNDKEKYLLARDRVGQESEQKGTEWHGLSAGSQGSAKKEK